MILTAEQQADVDANRQRYEQHKALGQQQAPKALPPSTPRDGAPLKPASIIHRETVPGGWYFVTKLNRGEALRIVNTTGKACVSLQAWNARDPSERLNHADTIKVQWAASLRKGRVILSDMGRALISIVEDTSGAHDTLTGCSNAATNAARYGDGYRNSRDNLLLAAGKLGLTRRDVHPCVAWFAPVSVDADGRFEWHGERRAAGDFVDLRAEMNLLLALSNCPHPLDPSPDYAPGDVELIRYQAPAVAADDLCRTVSLEAKRAFENNAMWLNSSVAG
ncbi:MAG TPA: urea amidolyase associated protein UAAP1 [Rhodopseudomonas sp.]|uniref:urea amidolyase associated protein UAAP1 n=1 Tax=Rhodopseudomonas sp. TaxID=1078 RepID=UPI002ED7D956